MKKIILVLLALTACAENKTQIQIQTPAEPQEKAESLEIKNFSFIQNDSVLLTNVVEANAVEYNNSLVYLFDFGMNGNLSIGTSNDDRQSIGDDYRFAYIMKYQNYYLNFYNVGGSVMLSKSYDLKSWQLINNGQPVLSQTADTIYNAIWNVGVTVDDNGVFHLLAETSSAGNDTAGLAYSTATMTGDLISFDPNRSSTHVIDLAGNPWLEFVPGRGLVIVYGKLTDNGLWYVSAATMKNGIFKESPNMTIGSQGIHVCDPHVISINGNLVLVVSYDQNKVYELRSKQTMTQFFDEIDSN